MIEFCLELIQGFKHGFISAVILSFFGAQVHLVVCLIGFCFELHGGKFYLTGKNREYIIYVIHT
jgi:hypothetical protein